MILCICCIIVLLYNYTYCVLVSYSLFALYTKPLILFPSSQIILPKKASSNLVQSQTDVERLFVKIH